MKLKSGMSVALLLVAAGLSGCVYAPPRRVYAAPPAPPPQPVADVVAYPAQGQSPEQLDRDRYECHNWAVKQSGFDPSQPGAPPQPRVVVVQGGPPPGSQVAGGAVTGAVLGALVSRPRDAGAGALIGAIAGAAIGGASESQRNAANQQAVDAVQAQGAAQSAAVEQRASGYRRAMGACLEGRGYTVR